MLGDDDAALYGLGSDSDFALGRVLVVQAVREGWGS